VAFHDPEHRIGGSCPVVEFSLLPHKLIKGDKECRSGWRYVCFIAAPDGKGIF
jgi:hypothetical protein